MSSLALRRASLALTLALALTVPTRSGAEPNVPGPTTAEYDAAHDALVATGPTHHLRIVLEETSLILAGTVWYWLDRERQVADWDYPSIADRLTFEAWRLDHNPFGINWIWHPLDGAGFHVVGRSNGMGVAGAALYGFGTSLAWELLLEFREKISINDVIVTPGTGVAVGEFFHWLGVYLGSAPSRGAGHTLARATLSPFHAFHRRLDRGDAREPARRDALGLDLDIAHRFELGLRSGAARPGGAAAGDDVRLDEIVASGRLVALPGYLRPVRLRRRFGSGNVTALAARLATTGDGLGLQVRSDTLLLGWHTQDPTDDGVAALTVGLALGYDYRRDRFGGFVNRIGQLHLPGPGLDLALRRGAWRVAGSLRASLDLAGLHALAYPTWLAAHPDTTEKEILRKQGYAYAWGGSARLDLALAGPWLELGAGVAAGGYRSIDGLDRNQELITDDVATRDGLLDLEASLAVAPAGPLRLGLRWATSRRWSRVGDVSAAQHLDALSGWLGIAF